MKLVIVGGGSSYTSELVDGVLKRHDTFPISEISLTDLNQQRMGILCGLAQRMVAKTGKRIRVTATTDRKAALEGATVNSIIRVGGMDERILDEHILQKYGVVGQ